MSRTVLRSVCSPCPSTIARVTAGSASASAVAWKRVPSSAPAAPSTRDAATPRPSAMPPAASTGVGPAMSATTGTNGSVERPRRAPWPPLSVPWTTMTSAPDVQGLASLGQVGDLDHQQRARPPDRLEERGGIAEREHDRRRVELQGLLDRRDVGRPAEEPDTPRLAGAVGDDRQFLAPARRGRPARRPRTRSRRPGTRPPPAPLRPIRPSAPTRSGGAPRATA